MAVGQGTILVNNEDFINGYQAGHLACMLDCRAFASGYYASTNDNITEIMMEKLEDVDLPWQYGIGYCIGWIATFATKDHSTPEPANGSETSRTSPQPPGRA
jgi:hypothetical protein